MGTKPLHLAPFTWIMAHGGTFDARGSVGGSQTLAKGLGAIRQFSDVGGLEASPAASQEVSAPNPAPGDEVKRSSQFRGRLSAATGGGGRRNGGSRKWLREPQPEEGRKEGLGRASKGGHFDPCF